MSDMPLRAPLRPLSQILPARERGENPDIIERKNIELRHETQRDPARARAQGRLLVLGIMFICIFAVITVRIGMIGCVPNLVQVPMTPKGTWMPKMESKLKV